MMSRRSESGTLTGQLEGRAALVTGGAKRIGAAVVRALAEQGAAVVVHFNESEQPARAMAEELHASGAEIHLVQGDLSDKETASGLVAKAAGEIGRPIDILINNASIFDRGDWDHIQAINLRAPYLLSLAFADQAFTAESVDIINLNDIRALRPGADYLGYTISKVGLHGLTQSLAQALAPKVRVNELALGAVLPPDGTTGEVGQAVEYEHTLQEEIPLRSFPSVVQVTDSLLFLLGNKALTGQTIQVDGGGHLG